MTLTPTQKGSFLAGVCLWLLLWAALLKTDDILELDGVKRWIKLLGRGPHPAERCIRWINQHKSTSLIGTECCNVAHSGTDAMGISFAVGGTITNLVVIYVLIPMLARAKGGSKTIDM
jgi:hypothetical protein